MVPVERSACGIMGAGACEIMGAGEGGQMSRVDVNGVGIEYEVTGEGRPVLLLHGFPDSGRLWRHQVPALADAGFQVIVPDLRGYGRSGQPEGVESYAMSLLAGDVMAGLAPLHIPPGPTVRHARGAPPAPAPASLAPPPCHPPARRSGGAPGPVPPA